MSFLIEGPSAHSLTAIAHYKSLQNKSKIAYSVLKIFSCFSRKLKYLFVVSTIIFVNPSVVRIHSDKLINIASSRRAFNLRPPTRIIIENQRDKKQI